MPLWLPASPSVLEKAWVIVETQAYGDAYATEHRTVLVASSSSRVVRSISPNGFRVPAATPSGWGSRVGHELS